MTGTSVFRMGAIRAGIICAVTLLISLGALLLPPAHVSAAAPPAVPDWSGRDPKAAQTPGGQIYREVCAACHNGGVERAPQLRTMQDMTPEAIHRALSDGIMREQGAALAEADRVAVAEFIATRKMGLAATMKPEAMCRGSSARFDLREPPPFAGWGLDVNSSHSVPKSVSGLDPAGIGRLRLKWAFGVAGAQRMRSQPTLAGGAIVFGTQTGAVHALDRESGCVRWTFSADAEVRTGIVVSPWRAGDQSARPLVHFGDTIGNVYAIELLTGRLAWKVSADDHPAATITAAPALSRGVLYVAVSSIEEASAASPNYRCCTFRGSVLALDAATGAVKWRTFMAEEATVQGTGANGVERLGPSGAAVWNTPVVDEKRGQLYFATSDNYSLPASDKSDAIVALDLASGRFKWHYQALAGDAWNVDCFSRTSGNCPARAGPDFGFGAGVVLARGNNGRELVLAGQKSGWTFAIDPDSGQRVWRQRVGSGGVSAGIYFGMAAKAGRLFVPITDRPDGQTYDYPRSPGMHALDIATGAFVWRTPARDLCQGRPDCHPGYGGAITESGGAIIAGSDDGYLRFYNAATGVMLREIDTMQAFETVNGVPARGGAISGGAAPLAYKGQVIVSAGYGFASKMPGNVLLVYGTD